MTKQMRHQLTGYDRATDRATAEYDIEPAAFEKIKEIAHVDPDDPDAVGCYPLGAAQIRAISALLQREFDHERYEFFLEPVTS